MIRENVILDRFFHGKTGGNREEVLQVCSENSRDGASNQRVSIKGNGNKKNTYIWKDGL